MKVAVTGGNGFLAGYLNRELKAKGIDSIFLVRSQNKDNMTSDFTVTDYSFKSLSEIFLRGGVNAIVHLAGPRVVAQDLSFYNSFFDLTRNLYEAAGSNGITNIVCASSISVYSGKPPYSEESIPQPGNTYGLSKVIVEHIGNIYASSKGLKVKNLRFAHLYGANEKNNYMINKFFRQAYHHEQIIVNGRSAARREMMYAKDAALAVVAALEHGGCSGTYNAGSSDFLTNEDIAKTICGGMSPELHVQVGEKQETIQPSYMDSERIWREIGFKARYTLESALPEIYMDMKMAEG